MRTPLLHALFAAICLTSAPADAAWFGNKQKDVDRLLLFPAIAYPSRLPGEYKIDLRVIAIDTGGPNGSAGRSVFKLMCGGDDTFFDERWAPFTATFSAGSPMDVTIDNVRRKDVGPVAKNGRVEKTLSFPSPGTGLSVNMNVTVEGLNKNTLSSSTEVHMASPQGWGVISDIDDTIKISQVLSITKLLSKAFCQAYVPEKGMPEFYAYLRDTPSKPLFYYLSGSPWQLLSPIKKFIEDYFPLGEIIMDELNVRCVKSLIHSVDIVDYKKDHIKKIFKKFPERKWLLIGDASEHDMGIYASIYEEFPDKVCHIFIRLVEGTNPAVESQRNSLARFRKTFENVPDSKWDRLTPSKIEAIMAENPQGFECK